MENQKRLKELAAASDCVIVGRAADVILSSDTPLKLFVYADMDHKVARCQQYEEAGRLSSPRQLEREIKRVDARRAQYHRMFSDMRWGDKTGYHLCINTTGLEIRQLIPHLAGYAKTWFELRRK